MSYEKRDMPHLTQAQDLDEDEISVTTVLARYFKKDGSKMAKQQLFRPRNKSQGNKSSKTSFVVLPTFPGTDPMDEFAFRSRNSTTKRSINSGSFDYTELEEAEVFALSSKANELTFRSQSFKEETTNKKECETNSTHDQSVNELEEVIVDEFNNTILVDEDPPVIYEEMEEVDDVSVDAFATSGDVHDESRDTDDFVASENVFNESREIDNSYINLVTSADLEERTTASVDKDVDDSSIKDNSLIQESSEYNHETEKDVGAFGGITLSDYVQMQTEKYNSDEMSVISFGVSKLKSTESNLYNRILEIQGRRKKECEYDAIAE